MHNTKGGSKMKKLALITMVFLMAFGVFAMQAGPVLAGEHGGSTISQPSGGTILQGTQDDAADLKKAAGIVRATDPTLAKRLEKMAQEQCGL